MTEHGSRKMTVTGRRVGLWNRTLPATTRIVSACAEILADRSRVLRSTTSGGAVEHARLASTQKLVVDALIAEEGVAAVTTSETAAYSSQYLRIFAEYRDRSDLTRMVKPL